MRLILAKCIKFQVLAFILISLLGTMSSAGPDSPFNLSSPAFKNEGAIPAAYSCSGLNKSPALVWSGVPRRARSLTLILSDPDAPQGTFVHWVVYNLSPAIKGLPEGTSATSNAAGGEEGVNGRDQSGYTGPCPPPGKAHHYHFRLYALDAKLDLKPGATAEQVQEAIKGHVIGSTELVATFQR